MRCQVKAAIVLCVVAAGPTRGFAQPAGFNYDESKVPQYSLPDPLRLSDGLPVRDASTWNDVRRDEVLRLFETLVYGRAPARPDPLQYQLFETGPALDGRATRKQVRIWLTPRRSGPSMDLLLYLPADTDGPVPAFLGLNFMGNHAVSTDPHIRLSTSWMRPRSGMPGNRATEESRGASQSRWDIDTIVSRGYAIGTIYYGDIDPDFDDGFENGVHPHYYGPGQQRPAADEWGSIAAWAFGLSCALTYLETDADVDAARVAVLGHSRLGKTALWAGAADPRFALVISNNSGCGGAALSRRAFGETVKRINTSFPHWFCDNFTNYNDREAECPVDQHMLLALIAPRPVYVASATEDQWADPRGEFLAARYASPVYELLGRPALSNTEMPAPDHPVMTTVGYHLRTGRHDVTDYDWQQYLQFADKHLK